MKMQFIDGEEWPPSVAEADVQMNYPPGVPKHKQFALGHEFFSLLPGSGVKTNELKGIQTGSMGCRFVKSE